MPCSEETRHFLDLVSVHDGSVAGDAHGQKAVADIREVDVDRVDGRDEPPLVLGHGYLQVLFGLLAQRVALVERMQRPQKVRQLVQLMDEPFDAQQMRVAQSC